MMFGQPNASAGENKKFPKGARRFWETFLEISAIILFLEENNLLGGIVIIRIIPVDITIVITSYMLSG